MVGTLNDTNSSHDAVVNVQLESLDDTDCYASAWADALAAYNNDNDNNNNNNNKLWGGRGKGGRGLARRTFQPKDIIVENVRLAYLAGGGGGGGGSRSSTTATTTTSGNSCSSSSSDALLDGATLKLLHGHVYTLLGRNGCGKSTLLRRMQAGKIPGLSPHLSTLYLPQEVMHHISTTTTASVETSNTTSTTTTRTITTPLDIVLGYHDTYVQNATAAAKGRIAELEDELDQMNIGGSSQPNDKEDGGCANQDDDDDNDNDEEQHQDKMERICDEIAILEEHVEEGYDVQIVRQQAKEALEFFFATADDDERPSWFLEEDCDYNRLSGGQRKKVLLSVALFCQPNVLLLDEPTNHLDVHGLLQLRRLIDMCQRRGTTVLLISHDVDLINDVATDVLYFANRQLHYFPGNYDNFIQLKQQQGLHGLRQHVALEKKRQGMLQTLDHLKQQAVPKRGGAKKKARAIASHKKKMNRQGIEKDANGHRWTQQKAGTGQKQGSINALVDATTRRGLNPAQLLKQAQDNIPQPPDKAVQFVFRHTTCTWGEPLITALDVGHGYNIPSPLRASSSSSSAEQDANELSVPTSADDALLLQITKKDGYLFDCVDFCVEEGSTMCILGNNGCGKSVLLRILAKLEHPVEGKVHHASGIRIGFFDQLAVDALMMMQKNDDDNPTALSYLMERYPAKSEQELRGELTSFGLSPTQASSIGLRFLSGGERSRLCLASLMLDNPPILFMDNPTSNLDVESVEALIYGLRQWNGTLVLVSHDANFVRSLDDVKCHVIVEQEGKLRRVEGGMDEYLRTFR